MTLWDELGGRTWSGRAGSRAENAEPRQRRLGQRRRVAQTRRQAQPRARRAGEERG